MTPSAPSCRGRKRSSGDHRRGTRRPRRRVRGSRPPRQALCTEGTPSPYVGALSDDSSSTDSPISCGLICERASTDSLGRVPNRLYYGDNLEILRDRIKSDSVDLCYIDPPFNSKRRYTQIYNNIGTEDRAQAQAFVDTWTWDDQARDGFQD